MQESVPKITCKITKQTIFNPDYNSYAVSYSVSQNGSLNAQECARTIKVAHAFNSFRIFRYIEIYFPNDRNTVKDECEKPKTNQKPETLVVPNDATN